MLNVQEQVWYQVYNQAGDKTKEIFGPFYCRGAVRVSGQDRPWTQVYKQVWMPVRFQVRDEIFLHLKEEIFGDPESKA